MGGSRRRDENGLCATVLHAILRIRIVFDRRREVLYRPLVAARLCIADGDKFDTGLLEGQNAGPDGSQTAKTNQGHLQTSWNGHLVEWYDVVYDWMVCE